MSGERYEGPVPACPETLDGADVVWWVTLDDIGSSPQLSESDGSGAAMPSRYRGIAVAQYQGHGSMAGQDGRFYVFFCDADWNVMNDLLEETFEDARNAARQAMQGLRAVAEG